MIRWWHRLWFDHSVMLKDGQTVIICYRKVINTGLAHIFYQATEDDDWVELSGPEELKVIMLSDPDGQDYLREANGYGDFSN